MRSFLTISVILFSYIAMAASPLKLPCEYRSRKTGKVSLEKAPLLITKKDTKVKFVNEKYSKAVSKDLSKVTSADVSVTDVEAIIKVLDESIASKRYSEIKKSKERINLYSAKSGEMYLYYRPKNKADKKDAAFIFVVADKAYCLKKIFLSKLSKRLQLVIK